MPRDELMSTKSTIWYREDSHKGQWSDEIHVWQDCFDRWICVETPTARIHLPAERWPGNVQYLKSLAGLPDEAGEAIEEHLRKQ